MVSQNPNVRELGEVLVNPKARTIMVTQNDLRAAYTEVDTQGLQFEKSLVDAHGNVEKALSKVDAFDGADETLVQIAREIGGKSGVLLTVMEARSRKG